MSVRNFGIALIQLAVNADKKDNIRRALQLIRQSKEAGADLVALPECFNSPYGTKYFSEYSESIPNGETSKSMSEIAKECGIFLVAGSIPEVEEGKLYNTSTVWNPAGKLICKHRKIHLFDIDIPGGIRFKESEVLSPGENFSVFDTGFCKVGLGICYDVRFEELARIYRKQDCDMILYPGAFNMTTGPKHWELLLRARAVDNELYVAGIAPAQDKNSDYTSWGHTCIVDPWGKVLSELEFNEGVISTEIDMSVIAARREQIPVFKQRRTDLYDTICKPTP